MKLGSRLPWILICLTAPAIAGQIEVGTALVSGEVSTFANEQTSRRAELSPAQLQQLYGWLAQHRSGWQGMNTGPPIPGDPIELRLTVAHKDGGVTQISVTRSIDGGHFLLVTGPGKMAYRSLGGFFQSWAATRRLPAAEFAMLQSIVGAS
jgi:hypothetical protein